MLTNPLEMADPKAAFASNPFVPVELDVRYLGLSPGYGGELAAARGRPLGERALGEDAARSSRRAISSSTARPSAR